MTRRGGYSRLISLMLLLSLIAGLLVPAFAATGEGIPIRVTRPDERIGSFIVWAEECDESGNPTGSTRYECADTPAPGQTMDYLIPVPFPDHRQDYLVHVVSVPEQKYKGFFTGTEKTMVWTYFYATGLALEQSSLYLKVGSSQALTPVIEPAGTSVTLTWKSSDEAAVTVDQNGVVAALAAGSAVITASIPGSGLSASCNVTVTAYEPPTVDATCGHADGFRGGSGTEADPYRIYSAADILHIRSHDTGNHFRQELDIDCGGGFLDGAAFTNGSYDGGYHVIKNFTMQTTQVFGGVFFDIRNSTVQRIGIENATAINDYGAVLVGNARGGSVVRECYTLNCTVTANTRFCGGLVGGTLAFDPAGDATIERCYVLGTALKGSNHSTYGGVGGIVGYVENTTNISDCYAIPYSINTSNKNIGAISGQKTSRGNITFGQNYFYPIPNLEKGYSSYNSGSPPVSLNPITEFSNPENFAFSSGDWVWREVNFKGAESGMMVPTIAGFAHQS